MTTDPLDPTTTPDRPVHRVRRLNDLPVLLVVCAIGLFLIVMLRVAASRARTEQQQEHGLIRSARKHAAELMGNSHAGKVPRLTVSDADGQPHDAGAIVQAAAAGAVPLPLADPDADALPAALPPGFPQPPPPPADLDATGAAGQGPGPGLSPAAPVLQPPKSARATGDATFAPKAGNGAAAAAGTDGDDELQRLRMQALQDALSAKTTALKDATAHDGDGDAPAQGQQGRKPSSFIDKLRQIQQAGVLPDSSGGKPPSDGGGDAYARFGVEAGHDRWASGQQVQAPRTRYELRAGAVLPATMVSGINSDLPGQITAIVAQDVRDTATGAHVLVPQASRLVGTYGSDVKFGQERVLVAWQRIVFPDGKALDIGAMPGADGAGYAGFADRVDNHYVRLFSSAVLMSGITAGISVSQDEFSDKNGRLTMSGAMSQSLGQQLGELSEELIRRQMNVAPTIEIRPGYRFNVQVTKDLTFNGPYQAYDYDRTIRILTPGEGP